ncbi:unnamed protein product [Effrenium voratum]|uniref:Sushi domain-containing protein n=1 Tax=Effrenium voratum TaxID=2562239 RepID=A0AA36N4J1_9DINO|nr:unnamed protein product [Effrenium voratum]
MGFLAILLRYGERGGFQPCIDGIKRKCRAAVWLLTCGHCCHCWPCSKLWSLCRRRNSGSSESKWRCCCCLPCVSWSSCPLCVKDDMNQRPEVLEEGKAEDTSKDGFCFRWYWFHLAGQAGFIVREMFVIQMLDGWYWEVCAANIAMWMVVVFTARQIWQFAKVRAQSPKAVDQILDMLLLPINYGFLCALCVRVLKLENTEQNRMIVSAVIDSADIWEAWALWSVLKLFVKIVDSASAKVVERDKMKAPQELGREGERESVKAPTRSRKREAEAIEDLVRKVESEPLEALKRTTSAPAGRWQNRGIERAISEERLGSRQKCVEDEVQDDDSHHLFHCWGAQHFSEQLEQPALEPPVHAPEAQVTPETDVSEASASVVLAAEGSPEKHGTDHWFLKVVALTKSVHLTVVQAWVSLLILATMGEIFVKGIVAPTMPTLCYKAYGNCDNCNTWYDQNVQVTTQAIIYALCSFALFFVFTFERMFNIFLEPIEPYWKFWGVKIVVSVTYFQWLIIKYFLRLEDEQIYLWHTLLCCIEMPLLSLLHATCAYPYGKEWVTALLTELCEEGSTFKKPKPTADACCKRFMQCLRTFALFAINASASVVIICWFLPPALDAHQMPPFYNFTCSQASVPGFLQDHHLGSHWKLPSSGPGEWLPLCGSRAFGCELGYRGSPVVSCSAAGHMYVSGTCELVGCGPPIKVDHADPQIDDRQARQNGFTSGMTLKYKCERGYKGQPSAVCGNDGNWVVYEDNRCQLIGCGSLQTFLQQSVQTSKAEPWQASMAMVEKHDLDRSFVGEVVHFRCLPGYWGRPVAACHEGGHWDITDVCVKFETSSRCACKPRWEHCGGWLQTDCKDDYFGCSFAGKSYSWCEVDPGSCPEEALGLLGMEPAWDYCVSDNFGINWRPRQVADRGVLPSTTGLYIAGVFLLAAAVSYLLGCVFARALAWMCQGFFSLLLKVFGLLLQCASRTPGALRRRARIIQWQVYWQCRQGSAALAECWASLRQSLEETRQRFKASLAEGIFQNGQWDRHAIAEEGLRPEKGWAADRLSSPLLPSAPP